MFTKLRFNLCDDTLRVACLRFQFLNNSEPLACSEELSKKWQARCGVRKQELLKLTLGKQNDAFKLFRIESNEFDTGGSDLL